MAGYLNVLNVILPKVTLSVFSEAASHLVGKGKCLCWFSTIVVTLDFGIYGR